MTDETKRQLEDITNNVEMKEEAKLAEEYVMENAYTHSHEAIRQAFIAGYKAGQQNCNCVHTDNSAVIEELEKQNFELKIEVSQLDSELREKFQIIHDLRVQLPKWHKVADGDLPDTNRDVLSDKGGIVYYSNDGYWADSIGSVELDNVVAWCEIPKFEEVEE